MMQINGKDISNFGARKRTIVIGNAALSNGSVWNSGSLSPYLEDGQAGFQTWTITLWIKGDSTAQIESQISDLLAEMVAVTQITDPDLLHSFRGCLKKHSKKVLVEGKNTVLTLELSGYEYLDGTLTRTSGQSLIVDTGGNLPCPVRLEITPRASGTLTVSGCGEEEIVVSNVTQGQKLILDGMTGEMSAGGASKAADIEIWELPRLLPGSNTITLSLSSDVTIRYEARYM